MLTIHAAPLVLPVGAAAVVDGAVAVDGDRIAALGPYEDVVAAHPAARVRRWPGLLTPGLRQDRARELLTRCYHPDPREADELGELPLWGEAFERLAATMDATRRAGSIRRGLQRMLRHGTTHLAGPFGTDDPALRTAVSRSGLVVQVAPSPVPVRDGVPDLDPFAAGGDLTATVHGPLTVGGRADFAVFDVPDEAALYGGGPRPCVATVLAGRLVHRAR
ncbi:imidazolonepropionase-like domain-containing protein [Streptomyces sp. NPDC091289]|uniref:imidazolonepropionase-like domain-containing protein n=1 Tax=Streptomyces sp. NPDC091289 TaxID=3365989 RepID=UPI0038091C04